MLFEIFSAFFDAGGLAPIKAKKAKIAGRVRRQAIEVRFLSAYVFLCQPAWPVLLCTKALLLQRIYDSILFYVKKYLERSVYG